MPAFLTGSEIANRDAVRAWVGVDPSIALYASSGDDTHPISLLHPEALELRVPGSGMRAPQLLLYVDRYPIGERASSVLFEDERTRIDVAWREPASASTELLGLELTSMDIAARRYVIASIKAQNRDVAAAMQRAGWLPDVFIGVCDGCRMGGNDVCVNRLTTYGVAPEIAARTPLPPFWITDHFEDRNEQRLPFQFVDLGRLSPVWGGYGERPYWPGGYGDCKPYHWRGTHLYRVRRKSDFAEPTIVMRPHPNVA